MKNIIKINKKQEQFTKRFLSEEIERKKVIELLKNKPKCFRRVMNALLMYANTYKEIFPSVKTLAEFADCTPKTVFIVLKQAEKDGLIQRTSRGHRQSNLYAISQLFYDPGIRILLRSLFLSLSFFCTAETKQQEGNVILLKRFNNNNNILSKHSFNSLQDLSKNLDPSTGEGAKKVLISKAHGGSSPPCLSWRHKKYSSEANDAYALQLHTRFIAKERHDATTLTAQDYQEWIDALIVVKPVLPRKTIISKNFLNGKDVVMNPSASTPLSHERECIRSVGTTLRFTQWGKLRLVPYPDKIIQQAYLLFKRTTDHGDVFQWMMHTLNRLCHEQQIAPDWESYKQTAATLPMPSNAPMLLPEPIKKNIRTTTLDIEREYYRFEEQRAQLHGMFTHMRNPYEADMIFSGKLTQEAPISVKEIPQKQIKMHPVSKILKEML